MWSSSGTSKPKAGFEDSEQGLLDGLGEIGIPGRGLALACSRRGQRAHLKCANSTYSDFLNYAGFRTRRDKIPTEIAQLA
jgi:hypothetical protein